MGGPPPSVKVPTVSEIGGAITDVAKDVTRLTGSGVSDVVGPPLGLNKAGIFYEAREYITKSNEKDRATTAYQRDEATSEAYNRSAVYQDFSNDTELDQQTQNELRALYASGATSTQIAEALNKARKGKGVYAVRKIKKNVQAIKADLPGRSQILSISKQQKQQRAQVQNSTTVGTPNSLGQIITMGKK